MGFPQPIQISGGEIRGLMDLRDTTLPGMADQLGEFISRTVEQINAAHNKTTASPPPKVLNGRDTGLDLPTAVGGFTGKTTVAILDKDGVVQSRVDIDFDAGTMVPGGAFTPASFLTSLNTAMGGAATASFTNGALSFAGVGDNRLAIDEGTSAKAGRGFSHFFGLNDLVRSGDMMSYETGLRGTDPHGFTPGQTISFRLAQADGKPIRDMTFTMPGPPVNSMDDLVAALNDPATGVGVNGSFSLDAKGALTFTGSAPQNATLSITQDQTQRGAAGPSMSQLFGLGVIVRNGRASSYRGSGDRPGPDEAWSGDARSVGGGREAGGHRRRRSRRPAAGCGGGRHDHLLARRHARHGDHDPVALCGRVRRLHRPPCRGRGQPQERGGVGVE